ncbi:threonine aldolase family protein [Pendulispora albinea]|uniref:Beta-eliminating lyase-related protein n=1 Tax=Pendulispora albinea TaxID=2741071 RepID=A0ABZ2MC35_9BACT
MKAPVAGSERDRLLRSCRGGLVIRANVTDGAELVRIGQWCQREGVTADRYGEGELVQALEKKVAALLGFEAACFMPTGTMGQLVLLRLHAERGASRAVGLHPSSHHLLDEDAAFEVLGGLHGVLLAPWERGILAEDVKRAHASEPLAVISVELPLRWTGYLPTWAELEDVKAACRERGIPLHLDGARLWECAPGYGRSLAEICAGCSSVYVSLYKTIGALGGAIVAGPAELMAHARVWRHRHGGNLFGFFPYAASAAMRIDDTLARLPTWVARARRLSERLSKDPRLIVSPVPTPTNLFHIYVRGERKELNEKRDRIARERRIWVTHGFRPARVPGYCDAELHLSASSDGLEDDEMAAAVLALVS